jgi:class 3 adenylate cyclase/tetratricopeptide (TPR) repeat protein
MVGREQLEQAIAALEAQRATLGDAVVDTALAPMREKLAALEAETQAADQQRKQITVLFGDVSGFTAMSETMDAEDVTELMNALWERLDRAIAEYAGTIDKHIGDEVMALWGAETAREEDPEQAIRAALAMQAELAAFCDEQHLELALRIGINTGPVLLGQVGTIGEFTAMGDTVNTASRLEQAAPLGGTLVSHATYRHVRGIFDVRPLEPLKVKGKRDALQAYQVLGARPRAFRRGTRGVEGVETRMVGREAELQQLRDALRRTIGSNKRQVVTITGEAGVGKSRLLYEFENWADLLPAELLLFKGRASWATQGMPYGLIRDLIAFRFEIKDSDAGALVRSKLVQGIVEGLGQEGQGEFKGHFIGHLLGFDFRSSPHLQEVEDDARQLHDRALVYLTEYFRSMLARQPVCILLEDLHWADHSSLDLLDSLSLAMAGRPWLIVCAARPSLFERRPHWGEGQSFHTRLELRSLPEQDSRRLVEEILQKVEHVPDTLRELVVGRAEGNPFYVEELIKMLIEDGVIVKGAERWHVETGRLTGVPVPPTLTGVLQARLDRLPPEERVAMQQASVVGRRFWDRAVVRIRGSEGGETDEEEVLDALSALRDREMVFQRRASAFAGTREYIFKHAILREVTYESVLKRVRRAYHGLIAEWLIAQSGERASEYTGLVADHLEAAGQTAEAITYLRRAGERAAEQFANAEAVDYFGRALTLAEVDDTPERVAMRYELLLGREQVFDLLGSRKSQLQDVTALKELAEKLDDDQKRAETALRQAHYEMATGNYPASEAAAREAIRLAQLALDPSSEATGRLRRGRALLALGESEAAQAQFEQGIHLAQKASLLRLEADCLRGLGSFQHVQGDYAKTREFYHKALDLHRESGDRRGESAALLDIGSTHYSQGNYVEASAHIGAACSLIAGMGDRHAEAVSLNTLGNITASLGDLSEARARYEQALRIHQQVGNRRGEGIVTNNLAFLQWELGDYHRAWDGLEQSLSISRAIGDRSGEGQVLSNLSFLCHLRGEDEGALEYGQQALLIAEELGDRPTQADIRNTLGLAQAALGNFPAAEELHRQALDQRRELGLDNVALDTLAGLAELHLAQGDLAAAQAHVGEILGYLDAGNTLEGTAEPFRIYLACYRVLQANENRRAEGVLLVARNQLQERAAKISDEELRRTYLQKVAAHREILDAWEATGGAKTSGGGEVA